jgi:flagellar basal-body rod modification protein FlgD
MMPATVTSLPPGGQLPGAPAKTTGLASTLNQNDFLKLLTTQLEHQNPLNPQSPSDFAAELAQFTTASGVQTLNSTLGSGSGLQAANLVGKNVAVAGNALVLGSHGAAQGAFSLSAPAKDVNVAVLNSAGSIVNTIDLGAMAAGAQNFTWNGKAADGTTQAAGTYSFQIVASAASGAAPTVTPFAVVPVTSVVLGGQNGPTLNLGGGIAPAALSAVQQVF